MEELYNTYGWYRNDLLDFRFSGASGMNRMKDILSGLRQRPPEESSAFGWWSRLIIWKASGGFGASCDYGRRLQTY